MATNSNSRIVDVISEMFDLHKYLKVFKLFVQILQDPVVFVMDIVEGRITSLVTPTAYLVKSATIYVLCASFSVLIHTEDNPYLKYVGGIMLVFLCFTSFLYYQIFKRVAPLARTWHQYFDLNALITGTTWIALAIILLFSTQVAAILLGLFLVVNTIYSFRLLKAFWGMSYWKIYGYSFLGLFGIVFILFIMVGLIDWIDKQLGHREPPPPSYWETYLSMSEAPYRKIDSLNLLLSDCTDPFCTPQLIKIDATLLSELRNQQQKWIQKIDALVIPPNADTLLVHFIKRDNDFLKKENQIYQKLEILYENWDATKINDKKRLWQELYNIQNEHKKNK